MNRDVIDKPLEPAPVEGEVALTGPDGVAISLTPDAADRSSSRLAKAAEQARAQGRPATGEDEEPPIAIETPIEEGDFNAQSGV